MTCKAKSNGEVKMGNLEKAFEKIKEVSNFEEWQEGDKECFVFNDGAIVIECAEDRELNIQVLCGECKKIDFDLDLLEE